MAVTLNGLSTDKMRQMKKDREKELADIDAEILKNDLVEVDDEYGKLIGRIENIMEGAKPELIKKTRRSLQKRTKEIIKTIYGEDYTVGKRDTKEVREKEGEQVELNIKMLHSNMVSSGINSVGKAVPRKDLVELMHGPGNLRWMQKYDRLQDIRIEVIEDKLEDGTSVENWVELSPKTDKEKYEAAKQLFNKVGDKINSKYYAVK